MSTYTLDGKADLVRKGIYLTRQLNEQLRVDAFDKRMSESEIIRAALEQYFSGKKTRPARARKV